MALFLPIRYPLRRLQEDAGRITERPARQALSEAAKANSPDPLRSPPETADTKSALAISHFHAACVRSTVSLSPRARSRSMIVSIFGFPRRDRVR